MISKAAAGQKVHLAAEEHLECHEESEVLICEAHRVNSPKLHEKVEIAIFAESTGSCRPLTRSNWWLSGRRWGRVVSTRMRGMKPRAPAERASADSRQERSFEGFMGAIKDSTRQHRGNNFGNNEVQLKAVEGGRKGEWAVDVDRNWRITFSFDGRDCSDVNYEDYH
jgi:plasmid maintenance system killer protein